MKKTLEQSIEDIVTETGQAGPFLFGTASCHLCSHLDHVVITLGPSDSPFDLTLPCDRCGQTQLKFLNLNGDPSGGPSDPKGDEH